MHVKLTSLRALVVSLVALATVAWVQPAAGQIPIVISTPIQSYHDEYSEFFGIGFSGSNMGPNGGFFFNNGLGGPPVAPFGPPFAGAQLGAAGRIGNLRYRWNLFAGQGSRRTYVQQTPMLTVTNGYPGYIFSGRLTPFVTSIFPVVNDYHVSPLELRLAELRAQGKTVQDLVPSPTAEDVETPVSGERALPPLPAADDPPLKLGRGN